MAGPNSLATAINDMIQYTQTGLLIAPHTATNMFSVTLSTGGKAPLSSLGLLTTEISKQLLIF